MHTDSNSSLASQSRPHDSHIAASGSLSRPNSDVMRCCAVGSPSDASSDLYFETISNCTPGGASDRQLIARVLNGETRASEAFVERYRRFVYSLLCRRDLRPQDRDDIYQELYARLWQHKMRGIRRWYATGMREFRPYLSVVVRHLIYDHLRRQGPLCGPWDDVKETPLQEMLNFDAILLQKEQRRILRQAIARLSTRDADIVCRRYFVGQSYQEIGAALGMTTDNVGVTLAHIRKRLRKHLHTLGIEVFEKFFTDQKTAQSKNA